MIRVEKQPEPRPPDFDFDHKVRQPGLSALAELTGQPATHNRRGPRIAKVADRVEDIPAKALRGYDYWTRAIDALHTAYGGVCAYASFYIESLAGPTVDHFVAIHGSHPRDAYEWGNYRLACSLMNSRKREFLDVLDPCEIEDGWFVLNLYTMEVCPGDGLPTETHSKVVDTIVRLKLNSVECKSMRRRFYQRYWNACPPVPLWSLEEDAPFLARELRRQEQLRPEDRLPRPAAPVLPD